MSENERETDFLRHCLLYDESAEHHQLQERITQVQCDERCVRRAVWWLVVSTLLATSGVCYSTVFLAEHPQNLSQITTQLITRAFCVVALGSLICMLAFCVMVAIYRKELGQGREECRRLAVKLLESRLGKPGARPTARP